MSKDDTYFLKGLAIILLLFHHNPFDSDLFYFLKAGARICVWIFIFISAYGFTLQMKAGYEKKPIRYAIKRIILLYSEMWFFYLYKLAVIVLSDQSALPYFRSSVLNLPIDMLALSILFGKPLIAADWYVNYLLITIAVFPLLYFLARKTSWFSIPAVVILTLICPYKMTFEYGGQFNYYILMVMLGILFAQNSVFERLAKYKHKNEFWVLLIGLILCLVLVLARYILVPLHERKWYLSYGPISVLLATVIILMVFLLRKDGKINELLHKLGRHSGNMYFCHGVFYNVFLHLLNIKNGYISFFACFAYSLLFSILVELIKKKTDYNKRIRQGIKILLREEQIKKQDA